MDNIDSIGTIDNIDNIGTIDNIDNRGTIGIMVVTVFIVFKS
jgi:hypothetical protein